MTTPAVIVINDLHPVKERHIGWKAARCQIKSNNVVLYEVVERWYRHPDAPEHALIPVMETVVRHSCKATAPEAGPINMLLHIEATLDHSKDWARAEMK